MKKLNYLLLGAVGLLFASCSQEEVFAPVNDGISNVRLTLTTGDMQTRAFAQGEKANLLTYAVYQENGGSMKRVVEETTVKEFTGKAQLNLQLVNGFTYNVVLWAGAADNSPYTLTFDETAASVSVDYSGCGANDDSLDAFYAVKSLPNVNGDIEVGVVLKRPLAQINVGTNDFDKAAEMGYTVTESSIKVSKVATGMNLLSGEVSGEEEVEFAKAEIPAATEAFPVTGAYRYLAMAYVLVGEDKSTMDISFTYTDGSKEGSRTLGSVPVQRNHRTNIYGQILTSNGKLNVELGPEFDGDENIELVWDGKTASEPVIENQQAKLYQPSELAGLANMVNEGNDLEGVTVILVNDFDMGGNEFPMIGASVRSSSSATQKVFKGTFDGNGKTVKNIKIKYTGSEGNTIVGFISSLEGNGSELKDITFENLVIEGGNAEQAGVVGTVTGGAKVSGVKVMSGSISSTEAAGGIVGRMMKDGTIENCENHASVSAVKHNVGGIVGAAYYTENGKTMVVKDCDNYGEVKGLYGVGGVVGLSCAEVTNCNNYGKTVNGTNASVGGVVGEQKATGKIIACSNYADIQAGEGSTTNYGAGGIVGWVRYTTEAAYPKDTFSPIEVSGCKNYGKHITGAAGVGGIVGVWYSDGECYANTNYAETITAKGQFAAGIVGNSQWTEVDSDQSDGKQSLKSLTVHDNVSYTSLNEINATGCKHLYVYINDSSRTTERDNSNPNVTKVSDSDGLQSALASAQEGDLIRLQPGTYKAFSYDSTHKYNVENVIIEANGAVFEGENKVNFSNSTTIRNATFKNYSVKHNGGASNNDACGAYGYIAGNFENCVFEGEAGLRYATITGDVTFKNCKFISTNEHAFHVDSATADAKVELIDCFVFGYAPMGSTKVTYELSGCTFQTNDKGFGGVGLRRPSTFTNCKFNVSGKYDHDEIALKLADFKYEFTGCTVNGNPLTENYEFAVGADNIEVIIDGETYPLKKTGDKPERQ